MGTKNNRGNHAPASKGQSNNSKAIDASETTPIVDEAAETKAMPPTNADETRALPAVSASAADETQALPAMDDATQAIDPVSAEATQAIPVEDATQVMSPDPSGNDAIQPLDDEDRFAGFDRDAAGYPLNVEPVAPADYAASDFAEAPTKKRNRNVKAFVITFVVLACVLGAVYAGVANMFSTKFLPNTTIGDFDVSMKSDEEVMAMLETIPDSYQVDIVGGKFSLRATGKDVGMKINSKNIVETMHENQNPWYWPWYILESGHDDTHLIKTTFDNKLCNNLVNKAVAAFNKKATAPTNATISFDEDSQTFVVNEEKLGTQLDAKAVRILARKTIKAMKDKAELGEKQLKQPAVTSKDKKLVESAEVANGLVSSHLTLTINGDTVDEIDSELLSGFVNINDKYEVTLNEDELAAWVTDLAGSYNTIGMERTYERADGKRITVSGGSYGWEVDQDSLRDSIMTAIKAGEKTEIAIPCIDEANAYTGRGQRDWGNRYIDVDLAEQHVRFYGDNGKIIWEADCISGSPDGEHDTPQGVWYVVTKESPSKLIGYTPSGKKEYETTVTYWMPFVGNSVGFHDATWQPGFGGSMNAQGYGSHGCVNLSYSDAQSLYGLIEPNDVVVVHY